MAYDKNRKLLFIHIPKTAGKSIEQALGMVDHSSNERIWRRGKLNLLARCLMKMTTNPDFQRMLFGPYDCALGLQHITYQEIELLNLIPPDERSALNIFSVVRNPYSRALSTYRHIFGKADLAGFKTFWGMLSSYKGVDHNQLAHRRTQTAFLINCRGRVVVDNLIRFESLDADFECFCRRHNLPHSPLPIIGSKPEISWENFYDDEAKNLIADIFKEDFMELGYDA